MARKEREHPPTASSSGEENSDDEEEEEDVESSSGEEEEEETLATPPPPSAPPSSGKKLPADAVNTTAKIKKPRSKPPPATTTTTTTTVTALPSLPAKRPPGSGKDQGSSKKTKTEKDGVEGKKQLFQRVWSEDDEIAILKGMIEYKAKKGGDPMADADDFLEFVKESLHVDANRGQFVNKVRRLKKKYENAKFKRITNPHELNAFELSNKIWGNDRVEINGAPENNNVKGRASSKSANGLSSENARDEDEKAGNLVVSRLEKEIRFGGESDFGFLNEGFLKEGMKLLDEGERVELEEKWKKHSLVEMEMYLKRLDLIRELTQKTLNALKSNEH